MSGVTTGMAGVRRVVLVGLLALAGGSFRWAAAGFPCPAKADALKVVAFGDSRAPYHPNKNRLLAAMQGEKPHLFLHLGDMVFDSSPEEWQRFDRQEGRLPAEGLPLLPVVGNHELRRHSWWADPLQPLFQRFPGLGGASWYQYRCGFLNLLVLNAQENFAANTPQRQWLEDKLAEDGPGFLVVALHRPPLTAMPDYPLPAWETRLQPLFQWARNGRGVDLVLSSHVHNYERFQQNNMSLVVTGGGGAPFYSLERLPEDRYRGRDPGLHYVRLTITPERLTLDMVAAKDSFARDGAVERLDGVEIDTIFP